MKFIFNNLLLSTFIGLFAGSVILLIAILLININLVISAILFFPAILLLVFGINLLFLFIKLKLKKNTPDKK